MVPAPSWLRAVGGVVGRGGAIAHGARGPRPAPLPERLQRDEGRGQCYGGPPSTTFAIAMFSAEPQESATKQDLRRAGGGPATRLQPRPTSHGPHRLSSPRDSPRDVLLQECLESWSSLNDLSDGGRGGWGASQANIGREEGGGEKGSGTQQFVYQKWQSDFPNGKCPTMVTFVWAQSSLNHVSSNVKAKLLCTLRTKLNGSIHHR